MRRPGRASFAARSASGAPANVSTKGGAHAAAIYQRWFGPDRTTTSAKRLQTASGGRTSDTASASLALTGRSRARRTTILEGPVRL